MITTSLIKHCIAILGSTGNLHPRLLRQQGFRDSFERTIRINPKYQGLPLYLWTKGLYAQDIDYQENRNIHIDSPHRKALRWCMEEHYTVDSDFSIWAVYMELPYFRNYRRITSLFESSIQGLNGLSVICHSWVSKRTGNVVIVFANHHILERPYKYRVQLASGPRQLLLASQIYIEYLCKQDILDWDDMIC